ncbi:MAG: T9SS type A sorting domain-containing protein [Fidelibacterota bacterium]
MTQVDYNSQIQPIFNNNCIVCHGISGGLSLASYEDLMTGGSHGEVIIAFDAENSILAQKIQSDPPFGSRMPQNNPTYFDEHPEELQLIIDWINEGAAETVSITSRVNPPSKFAITGSFPNPFNAATTITFTVPRLTDLELEVVNLVGQRVAILLEGTVTPGSHQVVWKADKISSGFYVARLNADGNMFATKLLLLK